MALEKKGYGGTESFQIKLSLRIHTQKIMKKLLLLLLCVPLIGFGQDIQHKRNKYKFIETEIIGNDYIRVIKSTGKPLTGILCTYYPNGVSSLVELQFVDGRPGGDFRWYHKNGVLAVEGIMNSEGEFLFPETLCRCWDEEGKLVDCESHVIDGQSFDP